MGGGCISGGKLWWQARTAGRLCWVEGVYQAEDFGGRSAQQVDFAGCKRVQPVDFAGRPLVAGGPEPPAEFIGWQARTAGRPC